ncbi:MAG: sugar phosphate isomerase/epimerase family protein [Planctomycetota bacterium]|jgi:sugar phosphate isomerase/epimerase
MNESTLTRRQMCRLLAVGPATLAGGSRLLAAGRKKPFALRYVLASSMYGTMKLHEILPEVRKTGAQSIDLWPRHHADQREQMEAMGHRRFGKLLERHEVRLAMTTRYDLGPFGLRDEMRVLKQFGGRLVVSGSTGPKNLSGPKCRAAVKRFVEQMKPHLAVAEETGVTIGIENHANALIHTPDSLRYLAEFSRWPRLGVALAPYHLPQDEKLLARLIEDLGPKLVHFYAWQYGRGCMEKLPKQQELEQMPGRGKLDFAPLLATLAKIDYSGLTEIFMHPVPRGIPILPTAEQVTAEINRARRYLEDCLPKL